MIPFSLVTATRVELQEMEPFPRKRRMSDSGLLLKSADNTVKLPYQEWLRLQRMELTAAAGEKRRELLEKELETRFSSQIEEEEMHMSGIEVNEYVSKYLETLEVRSASGTTDSGYRTGASSVVDPSEPQTEDPGKKSRMKLR